MVVMTKEEMIKELDDKKISYEINSNGQFLIRLYEMPSSRAVAVGIIERLKDSWELEINCFKVYFHSLRFYAGCSGADFDLYFDDKTIFEARF